MMKGSMAAIDLRGFYDVALGAHHFVQRQVLLANIF